MARSILAHIISAKQKGKKLFALLIDPDKFNKDIIELAERSGTDLLLVGGSIITNGNLDECISELKKRTKIPVLLFPGNSMQLSKNADGILFLSLLSGRNAEMLIGNHVLAAAALKKSGMEVIPTAYILIDGGVVSSAAYMSNTMPIPAAKTDIACSTAIAGELLGMKMIYLEAGSGAKTPVNDSMINVISKNISVPLIVGGGIRDEKSARNACSAGADVIVVGNGAEKDPKMIGRIVKTIHSFL
jgi:putative glycerol-1-phosphate prenyltransferase